MLEKRDHFVRTLFILCRFCLDESLVRETLIHWNSSLSIQNYCFQANSPLQSYGWHALMKFFVIIVSNGLRLTIRPNIQHRTALFQSVCERNGLIIFWRVFEGYLKNDLLGAGPAYWNIIVCIDEPVTNALMKSIPFYVPGVGFICWHVCNAGTDSISQFGNSTSGGGLNNWGGKGVWWLQTEYSRFQALHKTLNDLKYWWKGFEQNSSVVFYLCPSFRMLPSVWAGRTA